MIVQTTSNSGRTAVHTALIPDARAAHTAPFPDARAVRPYREKNETTRVVLPLVYAYVTPGACENKGWVKNANDDFLTGVSILEEEYIKAGYGKTK